MNTFYEILEYLSDFNPVSKRIIKSTAILIFILLIVAMYFALSAGRTGEYFAGIYYFDVAIENVKSILGLGCFFSLFFELVLKKYGDK